jgi:hypothetical protein
MWLTDIRLAPHAILLHTSCHCTWSSIVLCACKRLAPPSTQPKRSVYSCMLCIRATCMHACGKCIEEAGHFVKACNHKKQIVSIHNSVQPTVKLKVRTRAGRDCRNCQKRCPAYVPALRTRAKDGVRRGGCASSCTRIYNQPRQCSLVGLASSPQYKINRVFGSGLSVQTT